MALAISSSVAAAMLPVTSVSSAADSAGALNVAGSHSEQALAVSLRRDVMRADVPMAALAEDAGCTSTAPCWSQISIPVVTGAPDDAGQDYATYRPDPTEQDLVVCMGYPCEMPPSLVVLQIKAFGWFAGGPRELDVLVQSSNSPEVRRLRFGEIERAA